MGKEKPGDGSELRPMTGWQWMWRTSMGIEHGGSRWDIDVNFFDWDEKIHLYREGRRERTQTSTCRFELDDGARIEAALSTYGLKRAHLVGPDGTKAPLVPAPGTGERWRTDLDRRRPTLSRSIGIAAWVVLAVALVLQLPQLVQFGANITDAYAFSAAVDLPPWFNVTLGVAGVLAALDRALLLRNHWLLDS